MTTGEKLAMYRKQNNYTQEQLAELLGVSRQAISKWESNTAYPETEKLIKLSKLYECSLDYLLKEEQDLSDEKPHTTEPQQYNFNLRNLYFERKSSRTVKGVPLWHINIGLGRCATGIFALGLAARGVFSCGLFSMGVFSCGVMSLGAVAFGSMALGLLALGAIAAGVIALGALAIGLFAMGGCAIGLVSVGGAAIARYAATGDYANAQVAIGITEAYGDYTHIGAYSVQEYSEIMSRIDNTVPHWLSWAGNIIKSII